MYENRVSDDRIKELICLHGRSMGQFLDGTEGSLAFAHTITCLGELLERREADGVLQSRIETLLGVTCPRCEKNDKLFVEPETGFYTHTLGGNYCSAHKLHSLLNTKQSQEARSRDSVVEKV